MVLFEDMLISCCAPTLAGAKVASLFSYQHNGTDIASILEHWNTLLNKKNIYLRHLKKGVKSSLIYVYRKEELESTLNDREVIEFFQRMGYSGTGVDEVFCRLEQVLHGTNSFPHEIGLLLGYPVGDVKGFIEHKGRNYKCSGPWKVYGDCRKANRMFREYDRCKSCFKRLYSEGCELTEILEIYNGGMIQ